MKLILKKTKILKSRVSEDTSMPVKITTTKLFGITISETKEFEFEINTEIIF